MAKTDWLSRELLKKRPGGSSIIEQFDSGDLTLKDILNFGISQNSEGYDAGYKDCLSIYAEMEPKHD